MEHKGYLTRRDKITIAVALIVLLPLAVFGLPLLGIGAFVLIVGALLFTVFKAVWELVSGKKREIPTSPRAIRISQLMSTPLKPQHHYAIIKSEPRAIDEDPQL